MADRSLFNGGATRQRWTCISLEKGESPLHPSVAVMVVAAVSTATEGEFYFPKCRAEGA